MIGMAFWGTLPPVVVAWYMQRRGEEIAKKRAEIVIAHAQKVLVGQFEKAKKDLLTSVGRSIDGIYGNKVKALKRTIDEKLQVDAGPMGKMIGDVIGGVAEDYGYGKKKVVSNGIMALFRKGKGQNIQQPEVDINSYLPPDAPKIIEEFNRQ